MSSRAVSASVSTSRGPRGGHAPVEDATAEATSGGPGLGAASSQPGRSAGQRPLRLCIVDMNNAYLNQAMRCIRGIVSTFFESVQEHNPDLVCERIEVSPRDTNNPVPPDCDLYISSGGPGTPYDGDGEP